jgi:hypothetical protein
MRWWLQADHKTFSVDNCVVAGMDFSEQLALFPDLWMIQWTEGKGEIELQIDENTNANGLREPFVDITPYAKLFQQFLGKVPGLTLKQAKKVQIDVVNQLFDSKRQLPFHYPVAAGDYWWDASDDKMYSSMIPATQSNTATINQLINAITALVNNINAVIAAGVNGNFDVINSGISAIGNLLVSHVNSIVVAGVNNTVVGGLNGIFGSLASEVNNGITYNGNMTVSHVNGLLGTFDGTGGANTINSKLHTWTVSISGIDNQLAKPGLNADLAQIPYTFGPISTYTVGAIGSVAPGVFNTVTHIGNCSWTPPGYAGGSDQEWVPIGSDTPVTVTPPEQAAIIQGITDRTNELALVRNMKVKEINQLTTVQDVIDYDVLAGWPPVEMPPLEFTEGFNFYARY